VRFIEALCHKPEGRGSDSRWGSLTFGRNVTQGMTQPPTETSTSSISRVVKVAGALGPTNLPPPCVESPKYSGGLNLMQTVQACNGIATHLHTSETSLLTFTNCFPSCSSTGFSWFPYVYKQMLRWFPTFQVATTCFSCSPPDLNLVVTNFKFCIHVK